MTVGAGTHKLQLDYKGTNHPEGNIFIYVPGQRVLMLVDVIFPGWVPFGHFSVAASPTGFFDAHAQVLSYPFEKLVGGHLTRYGTREDVVIQEEYLDDVRESTMAAFSAELLETVKASVDTSNVWALFAGYWDAVAGGAADDVAPRWVDRLGGADIFTLPTAWSMAQTLRIDDTFTGPFGIRE
jgi:hypothetical protein